MPVNDDKFKAVVNGSQQSVKPVPLKAPANRAANGNSNQFKTQDLNTGSVQEPKQGVERIQTEVNQAISGLKQAELTHAAEAFDRLDNQFEIDTDRISQAAELLLDPRVKVATGILKAVERINTRTEEELTIPFGGYEFVLPRIPSGLDFSRWYSHGQSDHLLGASGNGSNTSTPSQPE